MGRPSNRAQRRSEILAAFAEVFAEQGYAGSTISAVAARADLSPGLLHHHFGSKQEMLDALFKERVSKFRSRVKSFQSSRDPLRAYVDSALKLDERGDLVAARCWVGLFAEAIRRPTLFAQVRRLIDREIVLIQTHSNHTLSEHDAGAILAYVIGALILGAFAPRKSASYVAPQLHQILDTLEDRERSSSSSKRSRSRPPSS